MSGLALTAGSLLAGVSGDGTKVDGGAWNLLIPLIIALPLAGFLFTAVVGRRLGKRPISCPVGAIGIAWVIGMAAAYSALTGAAPFGTTGYGNELYTWIPSGTFELRRVLVDNLTACL